ncbi:MAG: hypothetical protein H7306_16680 [Bacteriovorax sp.]|nr:hypothetical protein [Rhizobacter sp.]
MEVFITPVQGQSPGTGGYDFIRKKKITTFAEMEEANKACVKHIPTRNGGDGVRRLLTW